MQRTKTPNLMNTILSMRVGKNTNAEWIQFYERELEKPSGVDDAHWAELTPKQKAVVAHRLLCISEYRGAME